MKRLKNIAANISMSLISTLIVLIIVEVCIRIFAPQDLSGNWYIMSDRGYLINKSSWTTKHIYGDRIANYRLNELHLRGPEVDNSRFKILALGDSFTFGWLLNEDQTYLSRIQEYCDDSFGANKIQILNGGVGGWGLADFNDYLKEFGDEIKPDMVVIYYNTDDIGRSVNRSHNPQSTAQKLKKAIAYSEFYKWLLEHSHLVQWTKQKLVNISAKKDVEAPEQQQDSTRVIVPKSSLTKEQFSSSVELGSSLFLEIKKWCSDRDIPLVVTTTGWHFDKADPETDPEEALLQSDFFSENSIPFYDITPGVVRDLGGNISDYIIAGDYHPNEQGAALIAKHSWDSLQTYIQNHFTQSPQ